MKGYLSSLIAFLFGVVIASLIGAIILLKFNAILITLLVMGTVPSIAVWCSGVVDRWQLTKIGAYCAIGYFLCRNLEPMVSERPASRVARHLRMPLLGHDWHIYGSIGSAILGGVGVCFTLQETMSRIDAKNTTEI
jgi:hypothetical protein